VGDEHDIVGSAKRRIICDGSGHIDDISAACLIGANLDYTDILQCSCPSVSDETHRFQGAGKVGTVQSVTRFQDIKHIDDAAGLPRVSESDFNAVKKRFLRQREISSWRSINKV
jgi:hypothetical protein